MIRPLEGITVLEFGHLLSCPSAGLRLADLGARVIKIEPPGGESGRELYSSRLKIDGESAFIQAINRNKESIILNLKTEQDYKRAVKLIESSDVVIHNFRPGVMDRLGLDYESSKGINPGIIYGEITGFGNEGPWKDSIGQDLTVQALSGLTWHSGNKNDGPVPMGIAIADILAGAQLVQGILACIIRNDISSGGGLVQVSMMESILDFQFEPLTLFLNDGGEEVERTVLSNAHPLVGAPYGIYQTADGYIALAMGSVITLAELLDCPGLLVYTDPSGWFSKRDEIKTILAEHLKTQPTEKWLSVLEPADYWCADVLDWNRLFASEGFKALNMIQTVINRSSVAFRTTRCPLRIDGEILTSGKGAPTAGEDTDSLTEEFDL